MSLVVQVAGAGGGGHAPAPGPPSAAPPQQKQGTVVITAAPAPGTPGRGQPPPAHVSTPFSVLNHGAVSGSPPQHVVQHHPAPAPAPAPASLAGYPGAVSRPLPLSPGPRSRIRGGPGEPHRVVVHSHQLPTQPLPLLSPSPAHTILASGVGVNSPSLIPQNIPSGFMPRLPIHLAAATPTRHHAHTHHRSPLHVTQAPDTNILPPHAIRKLTRPTPNISHPDDDIEVGDSHHGPRHRSLMSPKHNRKSLFNNLSLQDHNYCAAPPPSPPRSPTPPISPYHSHAHMGQLAHAQGSKEPAGGHSLLEPGDHHHHHGGHGGGHGHHLGGGYHPHHSSLTPTSPAGLAQHPSVGGYPSPHYTGGPIASPRNRLKQSLEEAGVGPMTPLGDSESLKDRSLAGLRSPALEDGGEETETAPEAEDEGQDDSVTRCICDFLHDDGYMICCDKCSVWQHVVCMGLDKNNIPDEYLCEKCSPRPIDRKRAKALQKARAKEIYNRMQPQAGPRDSSEDEKSRTNSGLPNSDKNRKPFSSLGGSRKFNGKKALEKKLLEGKKLLKKPHKRRVYKEGSGPRTNSGAGGDSSSPGVGAGSPTKKTGGGGGSLSPRKNLQRKSLSATDAETEPEEAQGETLSLRSWIDNYEEAVTNHYSPELRARLTGAKLPTNFFKPKDVNGIRCNVSLRGNGLKVLTANSYIPNDTPVIECRGKYMLNSAHLNKASKNNPYVLQHRLSQELEVLVDGTTYGNDSRFCRRASSSTGESNAVIRHHLEKGSLHLYIVASKNIEKNHEILLPPLERKNGFVEEDVKEMSIAEELREIKKASSGKLVNGSVEGGRRKLLNKKRVAKREVAKKKDDVSSSDEDDDVRAEREVRIAKEKERLARQREQRERDRGEKSSPRKTRSAVAANDIKEEEATEIKEEPDKDSPVKKEEAVDIKQEDKQLSIVIPKDKEGSGSVLNSPSVTGDCSPAPGKSPGKPSLGLPDQSGLIVGVNTINYDVSFRNKTKTREERKMEMIMKAFEAMERNEARKRNESETQASTSSSSAAAKPEKKRRRSNSTKAGGNTAAGDSALDQSSADEGYGGSSNKKKGRGKRVGGAGSVAGSRRRSRAKSGDSSAVSETETADETPEARSDHFKYPGHRVSEDHDDDVSRQYIRGSRSPPGIANHLLRSARTDKSKAAASEAKTSSDAASNMSEGGRGHQAGGGEAKTIGCSAKKRWLMAAMSVDMSDTDRLEEAGTSPAPASPEPDYTPLKKRRLATYSNDASEDVIATIAGDSAVSEKIKSLPNGLKKRLISNLVLEAVLDKAMEDYKPGTFNDENMDSNNEDTSSPFINDVGEEEADNDNTSDKPKSFKDKRKEAIYKAEMDLRSNVSSESESQEAEIHCKELYVPVKKCPVPSAVAESPADVPESMDTDPGTADDEEAESVPDKEEEVPAEEQEFCSTPLQDENSCSTAAAAPPVPSQHLQFKSFFSTDLSVEDIDRQLEAQREALLVKEKEASSSALSSSPVSEGSSRPGSGLGGLTPSSQQQAGQLPGSGVKKRVSLADYKRRKASTSATPSAPATPSTPAPLASSLPPLALPSLPALPGMDTYRHAAPPPALSRDKETEHKQEQKDRSRHSSHRSGSGPGSGAGSRSPSQQLPEPEPPREDLTERLRKEFGLNIDTESDDADTDPELSSLKTASSTTAKDSAATVTTTSSSSSSSSHKDHRDRGSGKSESNSAKHHESRPRESSNSSSKPSEYSRSSSSNKHGHDKYKYGSGGGGHEKHRDSSGYRDKSRESRHHDKSRHGSSRRPSHPSSPSTGPSSGHHGSSHGSHRGSSSGMSLTNGGSSGGGARRHGGSSSGHGSPSRRSSQDKESRYSSSHSSSSSYYKSESSRRNFYTQ